MPPPPFCRNDPSINLKDKKSSSSFLSNIPLKSSLERFSSLTKSKLEKLRNKNIKPIFWQSIFICWVFCSLSNWIGSISGYIFKEHLIQAICYATWKLIAFAMLILCIYVLSVVRKRCFHLLRRRDSISGRKGCKAMKGNNIFFFLNFEKLKKKHRFTRGRKKDS